MHKLITTICTLALVGVLATSSNAQISISTNSFMPSPGTQTISQSGLVSEAQYNSLTQTDGGNQTWDVTGWPLSMQVVLDYVDPATAPFIDSFPSANIVTETDIIGTTVYTYTESQPNSLTDLGNYSQFSGLTNYDSQTPDFLFPIDYTDEWTTIRERTTMSAPGFETIVFDTIFTSVDAWGTIVYGGLSVPALRISQHTRSTTVTYVSGVPTTTIVDESDMAVFMTADSRIAMSAIDDFSVTVDSSAFDSQTDVRERDTNELPTDFGLAQNYPNPFNPTTEIEFSLPQSSHVRLTVYNMLGRQITTLVDQSMTAGSYTVDWDGTSDAGAKVASGVYLYRLSTDTFSDTRKMVLLK